MGALRLQFLLSFAVLGCVLPYLSIFFRTRGFDQTQVGYTFAIASVAVLLSPMLVALLADTRFDARNLMGVSLLIGAVALLGLSASTLLPLMILWYALHSLAMGPLLPLQDGLLFSVQARSSGQVNRALTYHRVRVWGTIGFILPSLVLFWLLRAGVRIEIILISGAICALAAAITARLLLPSSHDRQGSDPALERAAAGKIPTFAALRALKQPHLLVFCIATFLLCASTAPYYAFYPIYLNETVGIDKQWVGIIANVGVVIEIFFMLGFGYLYHKLGLRWLVVVGFAATAMRFALLAAAPNVIIAVGTQVFHGLMVLMIAVVPPVFLNEHAEPRFRHSMQGLYAVLVMGLGRIIGNLVAGPIAERSITTMFWYSAGLSAAATLLVLVAFRQPAAEEEPAEGELVELISAPEP